MSIRTWFVRNRTPPVDPDLRAVVVQVAAALRETFDAHGVVCAAIKNPSAKRLRAGIVSMQTLCHGHDQLRALVGRLERLAGVPCPQYDPGPLDVPLKCARSGTCVDP